MTDTDALTAAQAAFDAASEAAYQANLAYGFDPTPERHAEAGRLNKLATTAAYALYDARNPRA